MTENLKNFAKFLETKQGLSKQRNVPEAALCTVAYHASTVHVGIQMFALLDLDKQRMGQTREDMHPNCAQVPHAVQFHTCMFDCLCSARGLNVSSLQNSAPFAHVI